jgi:hypothetical protein
MSRQIHLPSVLLFLVYLSFASVITGFVGVFLAAIFSVLLTVILGDNPKRQLTFLEAIGLMVGGGAFIFLYASVIIWLISLRHLFGFGNMIRGVQNAESTPEDVENAPQNDESAPLLR